MSVPLLALRPHFPWTVAIATTNGDLIIKHLLASHEQFLNEKMIYTSQGDKTMFSSLQWTRTGQVLVADNLVFTFKLDDNCSFVSCDELAPPQTHNDLVRVSIDNKDILKTSSTKTSVKKSILPKETKDKIDALCTVAPLLSVRNVKQLAEILLFMEFNKEVDLY